MTGGDCFEYFLRPGDPSKRVLYEVERIRDGRSFSTRRVVAIQSGQAIFNMDISFQASEIGLEHSLPMPNVPLHSELQEDRKVAQRLGGAEADPRLSTMSKLERPFELRSVFELGTPAWAEARATAAPWGWGAPPPGCWTTVVGFATRMSTWRISWRWAAWVSRSSAKSMSNSLPWEPTRWISAGRRLSAARRRHVVGCSCLRPPS